MARRETKQEQIDQLTEENAALTESVATAQKGERIALERLGEAENRVIEARQQTASAKYDADCLREQIRSDRKDHERYVDNLKSQHADEMTNLRVQLAHEEGRRQGDVDASQSYSDVQSRLTSRLVTTILDRALQTAERAGKAKATQAGDGLPPHLRKMVEEDPLLRVLMTGTR